MTADSTKSFTIDGCEHISSMSENVIETAFDPLPTHATESEPRKSSIRDERAISSCSPLGIVWQEINHCILDTFSWGGWYILIVINNIFITSKMANIVWTYCHSNAHNDKNGYIFSLYILYSEKGFFSRLYLEKRGFDFLGEIYRKDIHTCLYFSIVWLTMDWSWIRLKVLNPLWVIFSFILGTCALTCKLWIRVSLGNLGADLMSVLFGSLVFCLKLCHILIEILDCHIQYLVESKHCVYESDFISCTPVFFFPATLRSMLVFLNIVASMILKCAVHLNFMSNVLPRNFTSFTSFKVELNIVIWRYFPSEIYQLCFSALIF